MKLFGKSDSQKLLKLVENFPDAAKEMSADKIKKYLEESLALSRMIDEAMHQGYIRLNLAEKLKNLIRKKGLYNDTIRFAVENKLYKK